MNVFEESTGTLLGGSAAGGTPSGSAGGGTALNIGVGAAGSPAGPTSAVRSSAGTGAGAWLGAVSDLTEAGGSVDFCSGTASSRWAGCGASRSGASGDLPSGSVSESPDSRLVKVKRGPFFGSLIRAMLSLVLVKRSTPSSPACLSATCCLVLAKAALSTCEEEAGRLVRRLRGVFRWCGISQRLSAFHPIFSTGQPHRRFV